MFEDVGFFGKYLLLVGDMFVVGSIELFDDY